MTRKMIMMVCLFLASGQPAQTVVEFLDLPASKIRPCYEGTFLDVAFSARGLCS
jgi:hypothetical protein